MASYLPILFLGKDSYVSIHDQLDGDVLAYCMRAQHLFSSSYPEFMNGMDATSLTPASPGAILFFRFFAPFTAYMLNSLFVSVVAYVGMYLCIYFMTKSRIAAVTTGLLFSFLPFYSVYGLSSMGQPLFFYAILLATNNQQNKIMPHVLVILWGAFSSLTLIGFSNCFILGCIWLYSFKNMFSNGHYHAPSLHMPMINWALTVLSFGVFLYPRMTSNQKRVIKYPMSLS